MTPGLGTVMLALADIHYWQKPPELVMLWGNPRGFGFAGNEMRRGQGAPLAGGLAFLLGAEGTKEEPAVTFQVLHNLAQLTVGWFSHAVSSVHGLLLP